MKWMGCVQEEGNTPESCSLMAMELFPLKFWRNVTADTARASFGTIFFIVEITKGSRRQHMTWLMVVTFGELFGRDIRLL